MLLKQSFLYVGGILETELTCLYRTLWLLHLAQTGVPELQPRWSVDPTYRAIVVLSCRWHMLHWGDFVDVTQTCKYNVCMQVWTCLKMMCTTHTDTQMCSSNLHKVASHTVSRCLEIPCSVMTSGRLQCNTGSMLWKISEDADLTLLGMTNFMECNYKTWAESGVIP